MAIAFRAATTVEAANTSAIVNGVPVGTVDGDLLLWVVSAAGSAVVSSTPSGWSLAVSGTTTNASLGIWYRIAASEPADYTTGTLASARHAGIMATFSGVDTVTPLDVAAPAMGIGTTVITCLPVTPVTAGAWVLGIAAVNVPPAVIDTTFSSSNLTAVDVQVSTTSLPLNNTADAIGHFVWTAGAFTPAYTTSNASTRSLGASLALRPGIGAQAALVAETQARTFTATTLPRTLTASTVDRTLICEET